MNSIQQLVTYSNIKLQFTYEILGVINEVNLLKNIFFND